jgi:RimJ/RimL family protein N-acetyltransferase
MFFSPEFECIFDHHGKSLRMGSVLPNDKKKISDGLKHMSAESIRNRFLGIKNGFSDRELSYLTDLDGLNHYALGVEELDGEERGIAIIRLVRLKEDATSAEVAITIIDEYQKQGMGSLLLDLIILAAFERNIRSIRFTYHPQNQAIEKLIRKKGAPLPGERDRDFVKCQLKIESGEEEQIKARLRPVLPQIDRYHSGT